MFLKQPDADKRVRHEQEYAIVNVVSSGQLTGGPNPEVMQFRAKFEGRSPLEKIVRHGAQQMLQAAIEQGVADFIGIHSDRCNDEGRRLVVHNGNLPSRELLTGAGPLEVRQPRVNDNSAE